MTEELLSKANDLHYCITSNLISLDREKETIENLKRKSRREDGTISIEFSDVGYVNILIEDILKVSEKRCEMLKEEIKKKQKEFDDL
jgi:hypothetical protein